MKCARHDAEAIGICTVCGNAVCEDCVVPARKLYCQDCAQKATRQPRRRGEPAEEGIPAGARRERPRRYERQRQSSGAKKTALLLVLLLLVGGAGVGVYLGLGRGDGGPDSPGSSAQWRRGEVRAVVAEELRGKIRAGNGAVERLPGSDRWRVSVELENTSDRPQPVLVKWGAILISDMGVHEDWLPDEGEFVLPPGESICISSKVFAHRMPDAFMAFIQTPRQEDRSREGGP